MLFSPIELEATQSEDKVEQVHLEFDLLGTVCYVETRNASSLKGRLLVADFLVQVVYYLSISLFHLLVMLLSHHLPDGMHLFGIADFAAILFDLSWNFSANLVAGFN